MNNTRSEPGENKGETCPRCKKVMQKKDRYHFGKEVICGDCYDKAAEQPQKCPNCGKTIDSAAEGVGLLLTPVGSSEAQKAKAHETLVLVCPHCRILFFDEHEYSLLEGLQKARERMEKT